MTLQSYEVFWQGEKQLYAGPESAFDTPLLPTHSSHLCWHELAGWGHPN